jgi:hypothetical protein
MEALTGAVLLGRLFVVSRTVRRVVGLLVLTLAPALAVMVAGVAR